MPFPRRRPLLVGLVASVGAFAIVPACGGDDERLVVFAASSLAEPFERIESEFEREHPDVDVVMNFGGSSSLAAQIEQGAPAGVFASADRTNADRVREVAERAPVVFARNSLAIAVERGNPLGLATVDDLSADDLVVVLAAPEVPAGAYAREMLEAAGVVVAPDSIEQSVRAVAAKIALGEADAGIVFTTDVAANPDDLQAVEIPAETNVVADYPLVVLAPSDRATEFAMYVLGERGRAALADSGFELP